MTVEKSGIKKGQESKKKKNNENHSKGSNKFVNNNSNNARINKKVKKNKNEGEKPVKKASEKGESSSFLWFIFIQMVIISTAIGLLYIVDYEKFTKVKLAANASVNKTLSLLPPEVVAQGRNAFEFVRPIVESIFSKVNVVISHVSVFLNKNPAVRDHWALVREISSVCGSAFADYLRTLYLYTCSVWSKLMP